MFTLATIETPTATAIIRTAAEASEDPDAPLLTPDEKDTKARYVEQELLLVNTQPITAKLRTTIRHLRDRAGSLSRFRGCHVALIYQIIHNVLLAFTFDLSEQRIPMPLLSILVTVLLCRIDATLTHIIMSEPSDKSWFRRVPARSTFKKLIGPTLISAVAGQIAVEMPLTLFGRFGLFRYVNQPEKFGEISEEQRRLVLVQYLLVIMVALVMDIMILIPATVSLTRVQASILPEENMPIVPFDRTFGGKVKPEALGGSGKVSMLDAWTTFDWNARIRLMKLYGKITAMYIAVTVLFTFITLGELWVMLGDQMSKLIMQAQGLK